MNKLFFILLSIFLIFPIINVKASFINGSSIYQYNGAAIHTNSDAHLITSHSENNSFYGFTSQPHSYNIEDRAFFLVNLNNFNIPVSANYIIFYGYSNVNILTGHLGGYGTCSNISNSTGFPNGSENPTYSSLYPFALKCNYNGATNLTLHLFWQTISTHGSDYYFSAYLFNRIYYTNEGSSDSITSVIDETNDKISETNDKLDQTNQNLEDMNDFISSDEAPDSDISALGNVQGLLPQGPIDSLLNIPFKFLSIITSSFSGTCVPLTGNFVFDQPLTIPCFSTMIYDKVPTYLMTFINLIPSAFILILYFKHLYKKIERAVSMETNSDDEWGVI